MGGGKRCERVAPQMDEGADAGGFQRGLAFGRPAGEIDVRGAGRAQRLDGGNRLARVPIIARAQARKPCAGRAT